VAPCHRLHPQLQQLLLLQPTGFCHRVPLVKAAPCQHTQAVLQLQVVRQQDDSAWCLQLLLTQQRVSAPCCQSCCNSQASSLQEQEQHQQPQHSQHRGSVVGC